MAQETQPSLPDRERDIERERKHFADLVPNDPRPDDDSAEEGRA